MRYRVRLAHFQPLNFRFEADDTKNKITTAFRENMEKSSEVFIGRQPILDRQKRTFAYELLYRAGDSNAFPGISGSQATIRLLENSFCNLGIESITGGKSAFINFSKSLLLSDLSFLDPSDVVIEVLEDVIVDEDVVNTVMDLKKNGFRIALDDFEPSPEYESLLPMADFVKMDWLATPLPEIKSICRELAGSKTRLIAEKIETLDHFKTAYDMGFHYFQGFFFAKPVILKGKGLAPARKTRLNLMAAVNQSDMDMEKIHALLVKDPALSIKVLRLVNSASVGLSEKISSIRQAVILLGERRLKQWLAIIFLSSVSRGKPDALFNMAVVRAGFSEKIAREIGYPELGPPAFMAGLLSMVEALFNIPAEKVLKGLPLCREITDAIIFKKGLIHPLILLSRACEQADMRFVHEFSSRTGLGADRIGDCWIDAVRWATESTINLASA